MRLACLLLASSLLAFPAVAIASDVRVALVIGNSAYEAVGRLPNPNSDAALVADTLRSDGFAVTLVEDATRAAMLRALNSFNDAADQADWAVVYYAGHGLEVGGTNYLLPTDVHLKVDRDTRDEAVSLDRVLDTVAKARKLRLVILDACRDNPFAATMKRSVATRGVDRGLSRPEPQDDIMVVYAAAAGAVAADGEGGHSPFSSALVSRMKEPGLEISRLFNVVTADVLDATQGRQRLFTYGSNSSREALYLVPPVPIAAAASDRRLWEALKNGADAAPLAAFRDGLPADSPLRLEVEARIRALGTSVAALSVAPHLVTSAGSPPTDAALATCDQLAPFADDRNSLSGLAAKNWGLKNPPEVAAACRIAVAVRPGEVRYGLQLALALMAENKPENKSEIRRLWRDAMAGGSLLAQTLLGTTLALDDKEPAGHAEGVRLVLEAAEKGLPLAQLLAGMGYRAGYGVEKDEKQALVWFRRSAESGAAQAMFLLGTMYIGGDEGSREMLAANHLAPDVAEGMRWLDKAQRTDDPSVLPMEAGLFQAGAGIPKDIPKAIRLYKRAADLGQTSSVDALVALYRDGSDVPRDLSEMLRWLRRRVDLADASDATAAAYAKEIAALYRDGKDVARDPAEALKWLRKSGDLGDGAAAKELASMYLEGRDAPRDSGEAVNWLRKAADSCCDAESARTLASFYRDGLNVRKDPEEAIR